MWHFNPYQPHICFLGSDGYEDNWAVPDQLAKMLEQYRIWGREDEKIEIRRIVVDMRELLGR